MSRGAAKPQLNVLLWQRAKEPQRGAWSLPGGRLRNDEDMTSSVRRQLAEKVDLRELAHLEQLAVFSDPHRLQVGCVDLVAQCGAVDVAQR